LTANTNKFRPITIFAPGLLAGAERVVLTGLSALYDLELNPKIIIIKEDRIPEYADNFILALDKRIQYSIVTTSKALDLNLATKINKILKEEKLPLLLHTHGFKALLMSISNRKKYVFVHTHHGNTSHTFKVKFYEHIAKMAMRLCKKIILVSPQMLSEFKNFSNSTLTENMLSLKNAEFIRNSKKQKVNKLNNIINLTYLGRLSPEKGILDFVKNFSSYNNKVAFQVNIVGDGPLKSEISEFIKKNLLGSSIKLAGFTNDPTHCLIGADLLIMPSHKEGLPMTLIESLASGIPVIANNVGAISTLIEHNVNGYLTSDSSQESWHKALDMTLKNASSWESNAQKSAVQVEQKYSANNWAKKTANLYNELMARSAI
jgi:glycosyltransferase involved in cell wall biosynthesis